MSLSTLAVQTDRPLRNALTAEEIDRYLRVVELENDYAEPERPSKADVLASARCLAATLNGVSPLGPALPEMSLRAQTFYGDEVGPGLGEGRTFRLRISPGIVGVRSMDLRASDLTEDRSEDRRGVRTSGRWLASDGFEEGKLPEAFEVVNYETGELMHETDLPAKGEIVEWTAKSRASLVRAMASLDYSADAWPAADGWLAMVTLTLPGWWQEVAPDGKTFKKHFRAWQSRVSRAGMKLRGTWKLEFQRRGAPHIHALMRVPALVRWGGGYNNRLGYGDCVTSTFEEWLAITWADVCGASSEPDACYIDSRRESSEYSRHLEAGTAVDFSGKDFSDPRRIAMYFLGHSMKNADGKEYQHKVPKEWQEPGKGPGRFWGYWGLDKAEVELDLDQADFDRFRRQLRAAARSRAWTVAVAKERGAAIRAERAPVASHTIKAPRLRRSMYGGGGGLGGGWVLLNDAPAYAAQVVQWLKGYYRDPSRVALTLGGGVPAPAPGSRRAELQARYGK